MEPKRQFLLLLSGDHATGKTTFLRRLQTAFPGEYEFSEVPALDLRHRFGAVVEDFDHAVIVTALARRTN